MITIFLDIDGVLITTPPWKSDLIAEDGYSLFDTQCVTNLNQLLNAVECRIILSSSRRKKLSLQRANEIFKNRGIAIPIFAMLPDYGNISRKSEYMQFIQDHGDMQFLIVDDDKSLLDLDKAFHAVIPSPLAGFSKEDLIKALNLIEIIESS